MAHLEAEKNKILVNPVFWNLTKSYFPHLSKFFGTRTTDSFLNSGQICPTLNMAKVKERKELTQSDHKTDTPLSSVAPAMEIWKNSVLVVLVLCMGFLLSEFLDVTYFCPSGFFRCKAQN